MGGQERDELVQADVAKEMVFKEWREMSNVGPKVDTQPVSAIE